MKWYDSPGRTGAAFLAENNLFAVLTNRPKSSVVESCDCIGSRGSRQFSHNSVLQTRRYAQRPNGVIKKSFEK